MKFSLLLILLINCSSLVASQSPIQCVDDFTKVNTVEEGCPCNPTPAIPVGQCNKGFVCGEPWAGSLLRRGVEAFASAPVPPAPSEDDSDVIDSVAASSSAPSPFICHSCVYGQYCPQGSVLPPTSSPLIQLALNKLACPAGSYCPTPGEVKPCASGTFCAQGTVSPITCNISVLTNAYPMLTMPARPTTVYESVYIRGQALAGNQCPANATSPTKPCDAGYYCPTPARQLSCPEGFYCRQGSQEPAKCPPLVSCPEGSSKASLSWAGFILLIGILVMLWLSYLLTITVLRMKQRRLARTQAARERLWKLLNPLFASQQYSKSQAFRAFKAVRPKLNLEFEDLGLTLHDGLPILSGVTGKFSHSRVAAIMGPSGAGKSTFLSVIMGKAGNYGTVTGHLRVNGREMRADQLRGIVGFVPQEDVVHEDLTVRENLVYSARLRLSAAKPLKEQLAIVDDVINVLQLRHIQHQVVGTAERRGISGGQRKRVNIGCELVSKPSVLFMDEPTSGLDSTAAADILVALKRMAGLGMNIVTVIHQPRYAIFSLFDDVMLLCKGGKLAYQGPSALALSYLESLGFNLPPNENPADFAMDVLSGSVPREGFPGFQPEDLVPIWQGHGYSWTQAQEDAAPSGGIPSANCASLPAHEAVDPQQLRLLEDAFDHADADEDGAIDAAGLRSLLQSLGVEPTSADVQMICTELAEQRSGLITRDDFLQYVRYGGRPPTADTAPIVGGSKRRVDSLYRVYSIEQYSLGAALAELAAAQLPAGLKDGPTGSGLTLKEVAAAVVGSDGTGAVPNTAGGPARRTVTMTAMAGPPPVIHEEGEEGYESGGESVGAARTSSSASVRSMRLPSPEEHGAELNITNATAGEDTGGHQQKESSDLGGRFWKREPISDSRRASTLLAAAPRVPENASRANSTRTTAPPPSRGLGWGLLRLLGLEVGTGRLRQTPGVLGQFLVLTARAGIKYTRNWTVKLMDLMLLIAAALATGAMHGTGSAPQDIRGQTALVMLTLGIISASTSLSVFSRDRLVHWRERDSGISVLPYFLANTLWNLLDVAIYPLVFVAIYQSMTLPSTPFLTYYIVGLLVVWWTTSAGCLISILVGNPSSALVAAVAVVMISGGFVNGVNPNYRDLGTATKRLTSISFNRWAVEGIVIAAYSNYPRYMWPLTKALVNMAGYCGLDSAGIPSIGGSAKGVEDAEHAPPWQETSQQEEDSSKILTASNAIVEEQDISVYCAGYFQHALLIMFLEGLILRLATLLALYVCPRGLSLEPLVVAMGSVLKKLRRCFRKKPKRRTLTGGGTV